MQAILNPFSVVVKLGDIKLIYPPYVKCAACHTHFTRYMIHVHVVCMVSTCYVHVIYISSTDAYYLHVTYVQHAPILAAHVSRKIVAAMKV